MKQKSLESSTTITKKRRSCIKSRMFLSDLKQRIDDSWFTEILAAASSVLAMVSVVVMLSIMNQRPSQDWNYFITFNSAISILTGVAQTTMLFITTECVAQQRWLWFRKKQRLSDLETFDNTTRGSYTDSIKLLFNIRSIAVLGALIIIGNVAFSPMVQQVTDYPLRSFLKDSEHAVSLRAKQYTLANNVTQNRVSDIIQGSMLTPIRADTYQPSCPESNCTWNAYPSLAVCGKCQSLESWNWTSTCKENRQNTFNCSWDLPNVVKFPIKANFGLNGTGSGTQWFITTDLPQSVSGTYLGISNPIMTFATIAFDRTNETITYEKQLSSHICSLSYCVQTLNMSVVHGNTAKNPIINTWIDNQPPHSNNQSKPKKYRDIILRPDSSDLGLPANSPYILPPDSRLDNLTTIVDTEDKHKMFASLTGNAFVVSAQAQAHLDSSLQMYLTQMKVVTRNGTVWKSKSENALTNILSLNPPGPLINSLTLSLSQYFRECSENEKYSITGFAVREKVIMDVRWAWMVFPLLLIFGSIAFLVVTIVWSSEKMMWKSSNAVLLLYGPHVADIEMRNEKRSVLKKSIESSTIEVQRCKDSWKLDIDRQC